MLPGIDRERRDLERGSGSVGCSPENVQDAATTAVTVHLSELRVAGFRNLDGLIELCAPLALVVGENNAGKSNVIDAIRLLLRALAGPREQLYVSVDDFSHDGAGGSRVPVLEIEGAFAGLDSRQRGRMVTCLAPSRGSNIATLK